MIGISFNQKEFEYDAYTLLKAFFPKEEVQMFYVQEEEVPADLEYLISIEYGEQVHIRIQWGDTLLEGQETYEQTEDRKIRKNKLKQVLYKLLSQLTGQTLPWGNLTGIRPTKIAMGLIESGMSNAQAAEYMRNTYFTSKEKTALAITIANRERELLKDIDYEKGYSLYVGIPFCPSICLYCSFSSSPLQRWKDQVDAYLDALLKELDFISEAMKDRTLDTIYIGGGTPTTLEPEQLERLLEHINARFPVYQVKEYTVEAGRPDSITREKLQAIRKFPVTRISVNPQTMNQATLELIGRRHTVEDTRHAFALARECGFDNINMDMITGLPGEDISHVHATLDEIFALRPESLTVHSLAIKRAAHLNMEMEKYQNMVKGSTNEMLRLVDEYASNMGMEAYYMYRQKNIPGNLENIGYCVSGKECLYNILIMEEKQDIISCGAGASSKYVFADNRIERTENVKNLDHYINRIDEMIDRKRKYL